MNVWPNQPRAAGLDFNHKDTKRDRRGTIALSGLENPVGDETQGVALGCHLAAFQASWRRPPLSAAREAAGN